MAVATRRLQTAFLIVFLHLAAVELQFACMDVEFEPILHTTNAPDQPLTGFVEGNLGIVGPNFLHTYLFWAYRHLAGKGSTREEREELLPWAYGLSRTSTVPKVHPGDAWNAIRFSVDTRSRPGNWNPYASEYRAAGWSYFVNCPNDAWRTATETLKDRIRRFGAESAEVGEWMAGQYMVFANCNSGSTIPGPVPAGLDPIIGKDREYQIAAAHFYVGNYL